MNCVDRYEEYRNTNLDLILKHIRDGKIRAGKYEKLIKLKDSSKEEYHGKDYNK